MKVTLDGHPECDMEINSEDDAIKELQKIFYEASNNARQLLTELNENKMFSDKQKEKIIDAIRGLKI